MPTRKTRYINENTTMLSLMLSRYKAVDMSKFLAVVCLFTLPYLARSSCPTIISRAEWVARPAKARTPLKENPPSYVVVHHAETPNCNSLEACIRRVRNIQNYHMDTRKWKDIGYNFLIGGDGRVYEGRGWGIYGSHVPRFNSKSIGICMIGNFMNERPSDAQLDTLRDLIACAKERMHVKSNYHLIGHRQGSHTSCPGDQLFNEIRTWPNFDSSVRV